MWRKTFTHNYFTSDTKGVIYKRYEAKMTFCFKSSYPNIFLLLWVNPSHLHRYNNADGSVDATPNTALYRGNLLTNLSHHHPDEVRSPLGRTVIFSKWVSSIDIEDVPMHVHANCVCLFVRESSELEPPEHGNGFSLWTWRDLWPATNFATRTSVTMKKVNDWECCSRGISG